MIPKIETLNIVKTHLLKQNAKSVMVATKEIAKEHPAFMSEGDRICAYRSPEGLKCAAGVLIPDALYHLDLEGYSSTSDPVHPLIKEHDVLLVTKLQSIYDLREVTEWEELLNTLESEILNEVK